MIKSLFCCAAVFALARAVPAFAATDLPMNSPATISGVAMVCTGVGDDQQHDPRWASYPLKIVFAGRGGQWLADADVTVSQSGKPLVAVHCGAPWLLLRLPPGSYRVTGALEGQTAAETVRVPASGQVRVILRFLQSGGAISPEHKPAS